jgi:peptidoglycan/xylan/chitin deacetylase (PgdA/CDA1 family)
MTTGSFYFSIKSPNFFSNQNVLNLNQENKSRPFSEPEKLEIDGKIIQYDKLLDLDTEVEKVFIQSVQKHSQWLASKVQNSTKPKVDATIKVIKFSRFLNYITWIFELKVARQPSFLSFVPENVLLLPTPSLITSQQFFTSQNQYRQFITQKVREELNKQIEEPLRQNPEYNNKTDFSTQPTRFQIAEDQKLIFWFPSLDLGVNTNQIYKVEIPFIQLFDYTNPIFINQLFPDYFETNKDNIFKANQLYIGEQTFKPITNPDCKVEKCVALSFDDGPECKHTKTILNTLRENQAIATFYVLGSNIKRCPELLKQMVVDGHEIGNHSWTHRNLTKLGYEDIRREINSTQKAIYEASGVYPTNMRPPYGAENQQVLDALGMPAVNWNVDPYDWKHKDAQTSIDRVLKYTEDGSVVLSHDIYQSTAQAYQTIIPELKKQGYTFVSISQLLNIPTDPSEVKGGKIYFDIMA